MRRDHGNIVAVTKQNYYIFIYVCVVFRRTRGMYVGEERIGVYRALVGKPEGKRPLGRTKRKGEGNIKIDF